MPMKLHPLPTPSDWKFLKVLSQRLNVYVRRPEGFTILPPTTLKLLEEVYGQIFNERPPLREEINELWRDYGTDIVSTPENPETYVAPRKVTDRKLTYELTKLKDAGMIEILDVSKWQKDNRRVVKRLKDDGTWGAVPNGHTALYPITAKGILARELLLTFPFLGLSLSGWNLGYSIGHFIENFAILVRRNRLRWEEHYLREHGFHIEEYQRAILDKVASELNGKMERFWRMCTPETLLLNEFSFLRLSIKRDERNKSDWLEIDRKGKRPSSKWLALENWARYAKLAPPSDLVALDEKIEIQKYFLEKHIIRKWRDLGHTPGNLEKHAPGIEYWDSFQYS